MNSYFCSVHQYIVAFHVHGLQGLLSSVTLSLLMNSTFGTRRLCLYKVAWVRMYILAVVCLSVGTRPEFVPVFSFTSFPSVHWFSQKENRQSSRTEIMVGLASFPVWMIWEIRTWRLTLVMPQVILVLSPSNYKIFFCLEYISVTLFGCLWARPLFSLLGDRGSPRLPRSDCVGFNANI